MKKTALRFTGFTLIELLVSISIGLILVSGGLAAYKGMGEKQAIKQAGVTLKTKLRSFQQKALSGEKPAGCSSLQSYTVTYVSSSSYTVQAICSGGSGSATTFDLSDEVEFQASFNPIVFSTLQTTVSGAPLTITLSKATSSYEYQVRVLKTGVISGLAL